MLSRNPELQIAHEDVMVYNDQLMPSLDVCVCTVRHPRQQCAVHGALLPCIAVGVGVQALPEDRLPYMELYTLCG